MRSKRQLLITLTAAAGALSGAPTAYAASCAVGGSTVVENSLARVYSVEESAGHRSFESCSKENGRIVRLGTEGPAASDYLRLFELTGRWVVWAQRPHSGESDSVGKVSVNNASRTDLATEGVVRELHVNKWNVLTFVVDNQHLRDPGQVGETLWLRDGRGKRLVDYRPYRRGTRRPIRALDLTLTRLTWLSKGRRRTVRVY